MKGTPQRVTSWLFIYTSWNHLEIKSWRDTRTGTLTLETRALSVEAARRAPLRHPPTPGRADQLRPCSSANIHLPRCETVFYIRPTIVVSPGKFTGRKNEAQGQIFFNSYISRGTTNGKTLIHGRWTWVCGRLHTHYTWAEPPSHILPSR